MKEEKRLYIEGLVTSQKGLGVSTSGDGFGDLITDP